MKPMLLKWDDHLNWKVFFKKTHPNCFYLIATTFSCWITRWYNSDEANYHFRLFLLEGKQPFPPTDHPTPRLDQVAANLMESLLLFGGPWKKQQQLFESQSWDFHSCIQTHVHFMSSFLCMLKVASSYPLTSNWPKSASQPWLPLMQNNHHPVNSCGFNTESSVALYNRAREGEKTLQRVGARAKSWSLNPCAFILFKNEGERVRFQIRVLKHECLDECYLCSSSLYASGAILKNANFS